VKALCLGGSKWQTDLIRRAAELGVDTVVADIDPACPGRAFAGVFVEVDTDDTTALIDLAREHRVDAVLADQSDRIVPIAACINEALNLPGLRPDVAGRFTDKLLMREALLGVVSMPPFAEVSGVREAHRLAEAWGYPIVLKPARGQSSTGVVKADDEAELESCFDSTVRVSPDGRILVEGFIDGLEITVEAFSVEGRCHVLALSEKEHYAFNECLARRLSYPPRLGVEAIDGISKIASSAVDSLGLRDGLSHGEYRISRGTPHLIEVGARGGGSRIASRVVPHVSGVDVYELLVRRLRGETVRIARTPQRAAVLEFFDFRPGKVRAVHGLDEVRQEGLADVLEMPLQPGDVVSQPTDDRDRHGYALLLGETRDEVDARSARVHELIQIEYEK
jgi:biotin carboxylase